MPRRYRPEKRIPMPDSVYNDVRIAKFINRLMRKGKKSTAERIFYTALNQLEGKTEHSPLEVFFLAMNKARPLVRVKSRRVGGSTYQVPMEVDDTMGEAIASRWVIQYANARGGKTMADRLSAELLDILNNQGATMKKRDETHRMAEANKAFAHYRY
ncbi:MAG: 30S ribosomal protein S7 [Vampirovibrionales bacterium]